jgi:DnaJ-class molecular chaperone
MHTISNRGSYDVERKTKGDLVVRFVHTIAPGFTVDYETNDVHVNLKIGLDELFCGFSKPLEIYGKKLVLRKNGYFNPTVPSRIRGMGLPCMKNKSSGDLVVNYTIVYMEDCERLQKYRQAFVTIFKINPGGESKADDECITLE